MLRPRPRPPAGLLAMTPATAGARARANSPRMSRAARRPVVRARSVTRRPPVSARLCMCLALARAHTHDGRSGGTVRAARRACGGGCVRTWSSYGRASGRATREAAGAVPVLPRTRVARAHDARVPRLPDPPISLLPPCLASASHTFLPTAAGSAGCGHLEAGPRRVTLYWTRRAVSRLRRRATCVSPSQHEQSWVPSALGASALRSARAYLLPAVHYSL